LLNPGEEIAIDLHPHWWYFAESAATTIGLVILAIIIAIKLDVTFLDYVLVGAILAAAVWLGLTYVRWVNTNLVITNRRLIFRTGVITKRGVEIPLERVNNVNFRQGPIEHFIGAGDLLIESGGRDGQQRFHDVRRPDLVQNLIHVQIEKAYDRLGPTSMTDSPGPRRPPIPTDSAPTSTLPPPPVEPDVITQLERLEGLKARGSISEAEFESQKAKLLGT
jgi:membrane protein YdbS with pleckstrin-like domain